MARWQKAITGVVLTLGLLGCTKPYSTPRVDEPGQSAAQAFPGLATLAPGGTLKVLWTHGMCPADANWAFAQFQAILAALGSTAAQPSRRLLDATDPNGAYTVEGIIEFADGSRIDITFLIWSPLTDKYRQNLYFDAPPNTTGAPGGKFVFDRAALNGALKVGLMNDCLVDAITYTGPNGEPIRRAMRQAVCNVLGGTTSPSGCALSTANATPTGFVSVSLGSKILLDAIRDLTAPSAASADVVRASLAATRAFYMLANQVPILDQADLGGAATSSMPSLRNLYQIHAATQLGLPISSQTPLITVAFVDPNDLLSYRLLEDNVVGAGRIINVIVSNDWTYLNEVERPDTAHCGYVHNAYVLGLIARGYDPNTPLPLAPVAPLQACLQ